MQLGAVSGAIVVTEKVAWIAPIDRTVLVVFKNSVEEVSRTIIVSPLTTKLFVSE